jgi:DNA-binding transcriptional LysR family regulator
MRIRIVMWSRLHTGHAIVHGMFTWDDARVMLAVQRTGSLSAAGRELGVNQSTVGRRLHALDEALGVKVFLQTAEGYLLSPAGERLLSHARKMEDDAFALERAASGADAGLTGPVCVTGPDALSARVLAPLLVELHGKLPRVDFELLADNRTLSLSRREADMAVRTARPREASVVMRRLCGFASAVYASRGYVERCGLPRERDLGRHPFVGVEDAAWEENRWLARVAPKARVVFKTNSTLSQLGPTLQGLGLGLLPCYVADPEPELVRVVPPERCVMRELWLVLHKDLQYTPRVRACADFLFASLTARAAAFEGRLDGP